MGIGGDGSGFDFKKLIDEVGKYSQSVQDMIATMGSSAARSAGSGGIDITAMFNLQLAMNKLSQFAEAVTNIMQAQNSTIKSAVSGISR